MIVPRMTASVVARHYELDAHALRRWMRRNANVTLLGTLDSPAMRATVALAFHLCGSMNNRQVTEAYRADPNNVHFGRGSR